MSDSGNSSGEMANPDLSAIREETLTPSRQSSARHAPSATSAATKDTSSPPPTAYSRPASSAQTTPPTAALDQPDSAPCQHDVGVARRRSSSTSSSASSSSTKQIPTAHSDQQRANSAGSASVGEDVSTHRM